MTFFKTSLIVAGLSIGLLSCGNDPKENTDAQDKISAIDSPKVENGYQINSRVNDFTLKNVDETDINFKTFLADKKGVIVIFTCNHCPYSIKYEDRIIALDKKYKALGFPVLAINPNDPAEQPEDSYELMQKRAKDKGFTFPYLFDNGQKVYPEFGAARTPHVFLVQNVDGIPVIKYIGAIDDHSDDASLVKERFVEDAVQALLNGQQVSKEKTKAIGCTIKDKRVKKS